MMTFKGVPLRPWGLQTPMYVSSVSTMPANIWPFSVIVARIRCARCYAVS
jgi:hypothetical protein